LARWVLGKPLLEIIGSNAFKRRQRHFGTVPPFGFYHGKHLTVKAGPFIIFFNKLALPCKALLKVIQYTLGFRAPWCNGGNGHNAVEHSFLPHPFLGLMNKSTFVP